MYSKLLFVLVITMMIQYHEGKVIKKSLPTITVSEKYAVCEDNNPFAPCQCQTLMTQQFVPTKDGTKEVRVEYEEYICTKNSMHKIVRNRFRCTQLEDVKTVSDMDGNPIQVQIKYKAGCELRCLNDNCEHNVVHMRRRNV